jgi:hypothetical protein
MTEEFKIMRPEEEAMEYYLEQHVKDKINEFCNEKFMKDIFKLGVGYAVKTFMEESYSDIIEDTVNELTKKLSRTMKINLNLNISKEGK